MADLIKRSTDFALALSGLGLVLLTSETARKGFPSLDVDQRAVIYGTTASIYGALLGFIIAGMTILMTMQQNRRMRLLDAAGQLRKLLRMFGRSAKWLMAGTFVALAGLMVDNDTHPVKWCAYAYVFLAVGVIYRVAASLYVLDMVADLSSTETRKKAETVPTG